VTDVTLVAPNTHSTVKNIDHHEGSACNSDGSLLGLNVIPAWAKSDQGNRNGQVKDAPGPLLGWWPSCAPTWRRHLLDCVAEKKGELDPRMIAEQLFALPPTKTSNNKILQVVRATARCAR
jgi:hypothetical protein